MVSAREGGDLYTPGLGVSPDGGYLLYAQKRHGGSNIMLVDQLRSNG